MCTPTVTHPNNTHSKEIAMSLIHTSPWDAKLPTWLQERPFLWPPAWDDLLATSKIRVEEYEDDDVYIIRAEAPGINPDEDVDLTLNDSVLRLDVRRRHKKKDEKRKRHMSEFSYGSFTRIITLPRRASVKNVTAEYEDGVLEVRVPLNGGDENSHRVPIKRK
jgi:HSP20 family protein